VASLGRADSADPPFEDESGAGPEGRYPRRVRGPAFESFRQVFRLVQGLRRRSRAPFHQSLEADSPGHREAAGPLRPEEPLVSRKGEEVDAHGLHVDLKAARGLGSVDNKADAMRAAQGAELPDRAHRAADV